MRPCSVVGWSVVWSSGSVTMLRNSLNGSIDFGDHILVATKIDRIDIAGADSVRRTDGYWGALTPRSTLGDKVLRSKVRGTLFAKFGRLVDEDVERLTVD